MPQHFLPCMYATGPLGSYAIVWPSFCCCLTLE